MNVFKNIKAAYPVSILLLLLIAGCKKSFLDEYNPSNQTADNYYVDGPGFESLVTSCYPLLRDITQQRMLALAGTDVFAVNNWGAVYYKQPNPSGSPYDQYDIRLNASLAEVQTLWDLLYREINRCNTAVTRAPNITGISDSLRNKRVAEAKFLRALSYFWAVQQWGDIPMPLDETTTANVEVVKVPAKDVYSQIISDLTECISTLPATQSETGRATKGAAQFLLARVYLTRGWNYNNSLGGSDADFTSALKLCDDIIASGLYPLESDWNNLWPLHNINPNQETASASSSVSAANQSKEVIFAVQYANASAYYGDPSAGTTLVGNNMHSEISDGPSIVAQLTRTSAYNRFNPMVRCTWAAYRLFDPKLDARYNGTFNSVCYATTNGSVSLATNNPNPQNITLTYNAGDTTAVARPWNDPVTNVAERGVDIPGGTKHYSVINANEYMGLGYVGGNPVINTLAWGAPMFWKFWQPGIDYGDGYSTFNDPLFRSAEVYLMAAEAIVKGATGAKLGTADVYYNKVLDRALGANAGQSPECAVNPGNVDDLAAVSYRATPGNITIDMILDERARELLGEGDQRWYDLKRTNSLVSRATKYNPWTAFGLNGSPVIDEHVYLRPIPQGELDNSNPSVEQNPGY
ncbi:RagB/SusD family nutrient uptake outer membrane protein [Parafilimonas terrae]|uniref:Starch-binding associating with outer membrane n=1 Tax=Parafilimonas terrae TaxID=1465490 RepID=A0A1I5Y2Q1_9BACT|nr:RagB/SusD family nutrient uptake outer membrane protein [Parafilimonas terrae]SFQ38380.1 Starch-binding associating with outer membrane [Parafilimonas terrae]